MKRKKLLRALILVHIACICEAEKKFRLELMHSNEQSRKNFANYLHDHLLQHVQCAKNLIENATIDEADTKKHLLSLHETIIESMRNGMYDVYPSALEYLGLYDALHILCRRTKKYADRDLDLSAHFDADLDKKVDKALYYTIYRMVNELLQNAVKHAKAKTITVIVQSSHRQITIAVIDDGIGFNLKSTLKRQSHLTHIGILSIKRDAAALGGALSYQKRHPHGTHAQIKLPAK